MTNETQQSPVEWFFENENYLYRQLMSKKINITEYEKKYKQSVEQAKEMEKEKMIDFAKKYEEYCYNSFKQNRYVQVKTAELFYETYGGNK